MFSTETLKKERKEKEVFLHVATYLALESALCFTPSINTCACFSIRCFELLSTGSWLKSRCFCQSELQMSKVLTWTVCVCLCQWRLFDHSMEGFKNWEFMTTHCWGEKAAGDWVLEIYDSPSQLRSQKVPGRTTVWQNSAQMFCIAGIQSFVM